MQPETLRDDTLDWTDRLFRSRGLEIACWAIIILAVLYFSPAVVRILLR